VATWTEEPGGAPTMNRLPYVALAVGYGVLLMAAASAGLHPWLGLVAGAIVMTAGITARQIAALRDNHELAVTDTLTGLANRTLVHQWLRRAAERSRRADQQFGVLLMDLDGFKQVNDAYGHGAGDRLLVSFADVLRSTVRPGDLAGRLGGDEFAVILSRTTVADVVGIADRVLAAAAATPALIDGRAVTARASIGIAVSPRGTPVDPDELLHQADVAMYRAKRRSAHGWELYDPVEVVSRAENRQISYRSVVALTTGRRVAVQAELPAVSVDHLERACRQVLAWRAARPEDSDLCLSVPGAVQDVACASLATDLALVLARTGFPRGALMLEVTSDVLTAENARTDQLSELRAAGIRIALDVSGSAPLPRLSELAADVVMLDRCFIGELDGPGRAETVAAAEAILRFRRLVEPAAGEASATVAVPAFVD
jgi:diguanylate cyclase (GGDEF)-like protein